MLIFYVLLLFLFTLSLANSTTQIKYTHRRIHTYFVISRPKFYKFHYLNCLEYLWPHSPSHHCRHANTHTYEWLRFKQAAGAFRQPSASKSPALVFVVCGALAPLSISSSPRS
uniref:Secreted protein n=1 Tax=Bactrocera dorsalis TaxID=27457 RepID=A0A034WQF5_BACDO